MENKNQAVVKLYITLVSKYLLSLGCIEQPSTHTTVSRYFKYNDVKFRVSNHLPSQHTNQYLIVIDNLHPSSYFLCFVNRTPMICKTLADVKQSIYNYIIMQTTLTRQANDEIVRKNNRIKQQLNNIIEKSNKHKKELSDYKQKYKETRDKLREKNKLINQQKQNINKITKENNVIKHNYEFLQCLNELVLKHKQELNDAI